MKQWKKKLAWLLSVICILVTVQLPSIPAKAATTINFEEKLAAEQQKFPAGKYWNHYYGAYLNDFTDTGNNPDGYTNEACTNHNGNGNPDCNFFNGGWQCCGYARKIYFDVYGKYLTTQEDVVSSSSINNIEKGDYVQVFTGYYNLNGDPIYHYFFVTNRNGNTLTVTECNTTGAPCKIFWNNTYTIDAGNNRVYDCQYGCYYAFIKTTHKPSDVTFSNENTQPTNNDPVGDVNTISSTENII